MMVRFCFGFILVLISFGPLKTANASIMGERGWYVVGLDTIHRFLPSLDTGCYVLTRGGVCQDLSKDGQKLERFAVSWSLENSFDLDAARAGLISVKEIFDCVINRCQRYETVSDYDRNLIRETSEPILKYLECIIHIDRDRYVYQAALAKERAKTRFAKERAKARLEGNQFYNPPYSHHYSLAYLFMDQHTFTECSEHKLTQKTLEVLRNFNNKTFPVRF